MKIINFTAGAKAAVTSHRDKLAATLADFVKASNSGAVALLKSEETLTAETATLENAKPEDIDAIRSLGEKRLMLETVRRRIAELPPVHELIDTQLRTVLRESGAVISKAILPTYDAYVAEIAVGLIPYSLNASYAKHLASQTSAATNLAGLVHPRFSCAPGGPAVQMAKAVLRRLDEIKTGEIDYSFTPQA